MKDESFEFIKGHGNKVSVVGFGSYGEVKLAKNTETGEVVAIKMVNLTRYRFMVKMQNKKLMSIISLITLISFISSTTTMTRTKI